MPYLPAETVLGSFADFLREDVTAALPEDESVMRAQVGSASSSLSFLQRTVAGRRTATNNQQQALARALDNVTDRLADADRDLAEVSSTVSAERDRIAHLSPGDLGDFEREWELVAACNAVLEAIEHEVEDPEGSDGTDLRRHLRTPLYEFIETRFRSHLAMLGRTD